MAKPDLVAPGNKLVYAKAAGNYLVTTYPELDAAGSPVAARDMMRLNDTLMASPVVAGAAAVMLQANPKLTPGRPLLGILRPGRAADALGLPRTAA